ncbi:MAG: RNA polymerase sigma factor [Longimicrobiales bacterium]
MLTSASPSRELQATSNASTSRSMSGSTTPASTPSVEPHHCASRASRSIPNSRSPMSIGGTRFGKREASRRSARWQSLPKRSAAITLTRALLRSQLARVASMPMPRRFPNRLTRPAGVSSTQAVRGTVCPGGRMADAAGSSVESVGPVRRNAYPQHVPPDAAATSQFSALYMRYSAMVERIALRILESPEDAEDVAQTVFGHVWQRRHERPLQEVTPALLKRATRNEALHVRARRHTASKLAPKFRLERLFRAAAAVDPVQQLERFEQLGHAIDSLPLRCGEAIRLRYIADWPNRAIAVHLGVPREDGREGAHTWTEVAA